MGELPKDALKQLCEPCRRENVDVSPSSFCLQCTERMCHECQRHHRKNKFTSAHEFKSIEESAVYMKASECAQKLDKCSKHPRKKVKYFCEDHQDLCCTECTALSHRKCQKVLSILDKVQTCARDNEVNDTIEELAARAEELVATEREQLKAVDEVMDKTKSGLWELRDRMLQKYDELFQTTIEKMQTAHDDISTTTKDNIKAIETLQNKIKTIKANLSSNLSQGLTEHSFSKILLVSKELKQVSDDITMLKHSMKTETVDVDVKNDLSEMLKWVNIKRKSKTASGEEIAILKHEISSSFTSVWGCVWQSDERILVGDNSAKRIETYNVNTGECLSSYNCPAAPDSMVKIDSSTFAISYPSTCTIAIMDMTEAVPTVVREIKTLSQPNGLAYDDIENYLVVQSKEGIISYVQLNGSLTGSLPVVEDAVGTIENTYNIAYDSRLKICYLSSYYMDTVMALDDQGQIMFNYSHPNLHQPSEVCLGPDDDIYVCSEGGHSVHHLNKDGELVREILTESNGLKYPWILSFNDDRNMFTVTCWDDKLIRVYDFY